MSGLTSYRPKQREIAADILTPAGWLQGTFVVPQAQNLLDFLNGAGHFLKLTGVKRPGRTEPLPFFALQEEAALMIVPQDRARLSADVLPATTTPLQVACLMEQGVLEGRIEFLRNLRLSDYLRQHDGFLVVREAKWLPGVASTGNGFRPLSTALVNSARITGIEESTVQLVEGHPRALPDEKR